MPRFQVTADNPWPESPTATATAIARKARYEKIVNEQRRMIWNLLEIQFGLVAKHERGAFRDMSSPAPGGSKRKPDLEAPFWNRGGAGTNGALVATQIAIRPILDLLEDASDAPVMDETGLKGAYDYRLTWKPALAGSKPDSAEVVRAIEEQLPFLRYSQDLGG